MYKTHTLRKGRISEENRVYLVTVVTHNRQRLFMDWPGARPVIHALRAADLEAHTSTHAWVLMPDHLHWLFVAAQIFGQRSRSNEIQVNRSLQQEQGRYGAAVAKGLP